MAVRSDQSKRKLIAVSQSQGYFRIKKNTRRSTTKLNTFNCSVMDCLWTVGLLLYGLYSLQYDTILHFYLVFFTNVHTNVPQSTDDADTLLHYRTIVPEGLTHNQYTLNYFSDEERVRAPSVVALTNRLPCDRLHCFGHVQARKYQNDQIHQWAVISKPK